MQAPSALGRVVELVRDLRQRCPWDRAQTRETLRPYFVEEALELDQAMGTGTPAELRAELGDVLLHVAFQIVLAEEQGLFGGEDLTRAVEEKMWRRHPHLFPAAARHPAGGGVRQESITADHVAARWESHKRAERPEDASVLDGLPITMPALVMAYRLQEKAAGVGFDWPDLRGPLAKVHEELDEVTAELDDSDSRALEAEIGDLLFAVVNLARKSGVDPRAALETANRRFTERFRAIERLCKERGIDIHSAGLEVLDNLWEEAKATEG